MKKLFFEKLTSTSIQLSGRSTSEATQNLESQLVDQAKYWFDELLEGPLQPKLKEDSSGTVEGRLDVFLLRLEDYNEIKKLLGEIKNLSGKTVIGEHCDKILGILKADL